jgi:DnaJ-domain-containing protein 1
MSDDLLHEILKSLGDLRAEVAGLRKEMNAFSFAQAGFSAAQKVFGNDINAMQQDVRMIRAALNDMARTNVTAGEVEAIHTDINRLNADYRDLAIEVEIIKRRPQA